MTSLDRRRFLTTAGAGRLLAGQRPVTNAEIVVVGAGAFGGWTALYPRELKDRSFAPSAIR